jgi:hypothetical protein
MAAAVLLFTMRCNIACAHCSVDSHPHRAGRMALDTALGMVRAFSRIPDIEFIDVSGGEPLLYRREIEALGREARRCGKSLRIVTNGFWARSREGAADVLSELHAAGIDAVAVSIDEWHLPFIQPQVIQNYVAACREVGIIPMLSLVVASPPASSRPRAIPQAVVAGLAQYGLSADDCMDMYAWGEERHACPPAQRAQYDAGIAKRYVLVTWQTLTAEGRARALDVPTIRFDESAEEPCDIAGRLPTVDGDGRLFPCCSPWVNRKDHALATVSPITVAAEVQRVRNEPLIQIIHDYGPKRLIDAARARGVEFPDAHSGICNQCGLLMDRFTLSELRSLAAEVHAEVQREQYLAILGLRRRPRLSSRAGS